MPATIPSWRALSTPLAAALVLPLGDYVLQSFASGARSDSYAAVAKPLAFAVAFSLCLAIAGAAAGFIWARFTAISQRAAVIGFGLAGPLTAAMYLSVVTPSPAFATPLRQMLLWGGIAAALGGVLTLTAVGLETSERRLAAFERALSATPLVLAGLAAYQILRAIAPGWHWAALPVAVPVAWKFGRNRSTALAVNGGLCALLIAAGWLGPREPHLEPGRKLVGAPESEAPPSVILVTVDTLRADELGFMGGQAVATPAFDKLAEDGVVFEKAYSTSGWTLPALSSIHLGVSPWVHGALARGDHPSDAPRSLAERFGEAGYRTAKIGYNLFLTEPMTGPALTDGFQTTADYPAFVRPRTAAFEFLAVRDVVDLKHEAGTDDLFAWATEWVENNPEGPFFLWLHIFDPHQPYLPPKEFAPGGVEPLWDDPATDPGQRPKSPEEVARMRALYRSEIAYVDDRLGRLLGRLEDLELYGDSLIVLASDHGEEFFEHGDFGHGHTLYDELLHVPLVLKLPQSAAKLRIEEAVSTLSLAPTLLRLADVPFDAADFSAEPLSLEAAAPQPPLFAAGSHHSEAQEAVIFDGLKLIRHPGFRAETLYDLAADPEERINLAAERPEAVVRGRELLKQRHEAALALRERLGVVETAPVEYDGAEKRALRSLGYIQ